MNRNHSLLTLGTIMALAAAGTAMAAPTAAPPAATKATCDALIKQADSALVTHAADAKAKAARGLRDKGEKECKAGDYAKGVESLHKAITDLGMKPVN